MTDIDTTAKTYTDFALPPSVVSRIDVSRLVSELERVDNEMTTASVKAGMGSEQTPTPAMSEQLATFLQQNQLTLDNDHDRSDTITQLRLLKDKVPIIHMTFAVSADVESLEQLAQWLRAEVHPQAVIEVGLQPALVAGVYLRTPNHIHDLSLRHLLDGRHDLLVEELETLRGEK